MNKVFWIWPLLLLVACEEAPLISGDYDGLLNGPSSYKAITGSNFALISNTNTNLVENHGSLIAYDYTTQELVEDSRFPTLNFGARIWVDEALDRVIVPDFDEYLQFFQYDLSGGSISFSKEEVSNASTVSNGLKVDEDPSDVLRVQTQNHGALYLVANQIGTITVVRVNNLQVMNLDSEDRYRGLRLRNVFNIGNLNSFPARGITRLFHHPQSNLVMATNPNSNFVYLFDPENLENEGTLSFVSIAGNTSGVRSVYIDSQNRGFFTHAGLQAVIMVDLSNVYDNGINFEIIEPQILAIFPVFGLPNETVLDPTENFLYVSIQNENTIVKINLQTGLIVSTLLLSEGRGPATLYFDEALNELISVNFFSNSMTRIDPDAMIELGEVQ